MGAELAYGSRVVLTGGTFTVPARSLTVLIGPNGSGKSTLLNVVAGLSRLAGGELVVLDGPPPPSPSDIAYVLQTTEANGVLPITVKDTVTMGRFARRGAVGRLRAADRRAIEHAMRRLEIDELANHRLSRLSAGQRQRVLVAQALAQEAALLLLDEPLIGLDLVSRRRILRVIYEERDADRTVVLATHDLEDAALADHVLLLSGRVVAEGPPGEVLRPELMRQAYGHRLLELDDRSVLLDDYHHHGPIETDDSPRRSTGL